MQSDLAQTEDVIVCHDRPGIHSVRAQVDLLMDTMEKWQNAQNELDQIHKIKSEHSDLEQACTILRTNLDRQLSNLTRETLESAEKSSIIQANETTKINQLRLRLERESELIQLRSQNERSDNERDR